MTILAIDPGTRFAGYAILKKKPLKLINYGLLAMKAKAPLMERIGILGEFFSDKIEEYSITDVCIETPFLYKNAATFLKLGYVRGVLYYLAYKYGTNIHEYAPTEVKQTICAKGNASKEQVARMIYKHFPTLKQDLKDDVTDAIAIGLTFIKSPRN